jgi:hypothetical protein
VPVLLNRAAVEVFWGVNANRTFLRWSLLSEARKAVAAATTTCVSVPTAVDVASLGAAFGSP